MSFSSIIGHKKQLGYLQKLLKNQQFAHAYLFSGPKSLGKATIAREWLEAITNTRLEQNPNFSHLSGIGTIAVEEIRDLRERLSLSGLIPGKKVALIDNAENMTVTAQNALLKTLEEPRGDTIIILVSHRPDQLLETIRSRCAEIRFHPVAEADGAGRPGLSIALQDPETKSLYEAQKEQARLFLSGPLWKRIAMIEAWVKEKQEPPMMQFELLLHERLAKGDRALVLRAFQQLQYDLDHNSNKQLALQEFARIV